MHDAGGAGQDIVRGAAAPPSRAPGEGLYPHETHNLLVLAIHQVVYRIGWIFKTESVIMPAVLDAVAAASGLERWQAVWRSGLPMLNRFGQSVAPVFFARRLAAMERKGIALGATTLLSGLPVLAMALPAFSKPQPGRWWAPPLFLILYAAFFCLAGLHIQAFGTVQGKLIAATRRGRLMAAAAAIGSLGAVGFAIWLMPGWLQMASGGYAKLFSFTGACFIAAGLCALLVREQPGMRSPHDMGATPGAELASRALEDDALPRDPPQRGNPPAAEPKPTVPHDGGHLRAAWNVFQSDANFRQFAVVVFLFCVTMLLFPHYQALAREQLHLEDRHLMYWVVLQNLSVGAFSIVLGPFSDRHGTRAALRWTILLAGLAPLIAIAAAWSGKEQGRLFFWVVFIFLGLAPITLRLLNHYVLEMSSPRDHPRYLGTLSLCQAAPFLASPLVGWCVSLVGYGAVFLCGAVLVLVGAAWTARLREPRAAHLTVKADAADEELP